MNAKELLKKVDLPADRLEEEMRAVFGGDNVDPVVGVVVVQCRDFEYQQTM